MDVQASNELYSIKKELASIISELESISAGISNDFIGVGEERCAETLNRVISNYYNVQRRLNNMNTSIVTDSFAEAHDLT